MTKTHLTGRLFCTLTLIYLITGPGLLQAADREAHIAIDTRFGTIEVRMLPYVAPNPVERFIHLT